MTISDAPLQRSDGGFWSAHENDAHDNRQEGASRVNSAGVGVEKKEAVSHLTALERCLPGKEAPITGKRLQIRMEPINTSKRPAATHARTGALSSP